MEANVGPGDRLPSISLGRAGGSGGGINLRHGGREATVIVKLPARDAARFVPYLERLAGAGAEFRDWSGRLLAVLEGGLGSESEPGARAEDIAPAGVEVDGRTAPSDPVTARLGSLPFPVLGDTAGATRGWAPVGEAAVVVADRFGVVYDQAHSRDANDLPDAAALIEWLRFLATQCPECGVPDEPGFGEYT
ncbi:MAG: hypothetical protein ACREM1_11280 [Longimicrobiales bacterium]